MAGIYIHIPFCKQACYYCDFHFSTSLKKKEELIRSLVKEILLRKNYINSNESINTIYFGGGTPSLLSEQEIMLIFEALHAHFQIEKNAEITFEANPDDLNIKTLQNLKLTPINRLSIGVQSFVNEDLKWMNRAHNETQAIASIKTAQDIGFNNITIDLIYGTPTLTNENWTNNLQTAFSLNIKHISAYCLTIEPQTVLGNWLHKQKIKPIDEDKSAEQFEIMLHAMEKNHFVQYEISNFCSENAYSKHNSNYWLGEHYLGLGPSAHSYNGISRQWNVSNNTLYIQSINNHKLPYEEEVLTISQQYNEYILTSLRTMWGVDLAKINNKFGGNYLKYLLESSSIHEKSENIENQNGILKLTQKGKLLADRITSDLFKKAN
jgi:oxygen-independent coproporphyrinogen-3 oxidase